jgi:aldehyde dehydrogenase (NAD+)
MNEPAFAERLRSLRTFFNSGHTRPIEWRKRQLQAFKSMLEERYPDFAAALDKDLRKNAMETYTSEIGFVVTEIEHALAHIDAWVRPQRVDTPLYMQPAKSFLVHEPLGVVLIMGAWNYPLNLTLSPLVAAMAAGNAAVIKPPRTAAATTRSIARALPDYLDDRAYAVVSEGVSNETILNQKWDKIFYTGSGRVGKIVMQAAARHLTPVTLELGGKSPAIVDAAADLAVAARRIVHGKFFNAGQTCVAPDYVLAYHSIFNSLLNEMIEAIKEFFGRNPQHSPDYSRIINQKQFDRLAAYIEDGQVVVGGQTDRTDLFIAPTLLTGVEPNAPVMQEEIFGPILPVLNIDSIAAAIDFVNQRDKPLALYIFSQNRGTVAHILKKTSSGGVCVNETMFHLAVPDLPFGGVGASGMGKYHGRWGFETFSNARAVLNRETSFDPDLRYPPYDDKSLAQTRKLMQARLNLPGFVNRAILWFYQMFLRRFGNHLLNRN